MMRQFLLTPLVLTLAACASAPPPEAQAEAACAVKIDFGSYCCGVDAETKATVEAYLAKARGVVSATSKPWGREGESTQCVVTRTQADTDRIYRDLAAQVPPTARRGPVSVTAADGRTTPTQNQR